jgi:Mitochondrial ribosomal protein L51 / S25 / CI-B8 domain
MGPGAVLLPPPPAPQLTNIHLRYPVKGPRGSARAIWRNNLQQLKFHNPAIPVTVEHYQGHTGRLTLQFEGEDLEALKQIPRSVGHKRVKKSLPKRDRFEEISSEEKETAARNESPNWRDAPARPAAEATTRTGSTGDKISARAETTQESFTSSTEKIISSNEEVLALAAEETLASPPKGEAPQTTEEIEAEIDADRPSPTIDEPVLKPQPPADPSSPSSTEPPKTIYMRTVTIGLRGHSPDAIWEWFQQRTGCRKVPESQEDIEARKRLDEFFAKAELDRQRVKAGVDAMRKEKEDLKRARGEAEKLQAEVI